MKAILGARVIGIENCLTLGWRPEAGELVGLLLEGVAPDRGLVPGVIVARKDRKPVKLINGEWVRP